MSDSRVALTVADFDRVVAKLQMTARPGKHRFVFLEVNGKQVVWTMRSNGRGELGRVEFAIRQQLKVNGRQMQDLVNCPMSRDGYIEMLRLKGLIAE